MQEPRSSPASVLGVVIGTVVAVSTGLVVIAGSVGAVVLVWRWLVDVIRGGCA